MISAGCSKTKFFSSMLKEPLDLSSTKAVNKRQLPGSNLGKYLVESHWKDKVLATPASRSKAFSLYLSMKFFGAEVPLSRLERRFRYLS